MKKKKNNKMKYIEIQIIHMVGDDYKIFSDYEDRRLSISKRIIIIIVLVFAIITLAIRRVFSIKSFIYDISILQHEFYLLNILLVS